MTPKTPAAHPLSDEHICNLWSWSHTSAAEKTATTQQHAFARAIERAHGIGTSCRKCGGEMRPSQAIEQTLTGVPDFTSDKHASTVSPSGPGRLINCMKCTNCGWSVT